MKKTIIRREGVAVDGSLSTLHPVLQRVYANRGVHSSSALERQLNSLLSYHDLLGITAAVDCLEQALNASQTILICGDFDADGATSTALAIRALKSFGAEKVHYIVPNRFDFGYGLTPELVAVAKKYAPDLIVTVDNGIANHAGVLAAKNAGIKVVITDHHLPSDTLPLADAIVNPNQPHDRFASKHMAGVGVIFYVMLALRRRLSEKGWFQASGLAEPKLAHLLDLVALGTVADVVPLDHNNRIMVYQGLQRIRAGQCIPGITALLAVSKCLQANAAASDLGFFVAPRLNAAGRLEDMSLGIELLLTEEAAKAGEIAERLNQLNDERRMIEQTMQKEAITALHSLSLQNVSLPHGICLFNENWHQGVIGILAARVKEKFHRPVIAFAPFNDHDMKGSARSIAGLHIRDLLAEVAIQYPNLSFKFGGHAMAAGLTLPRDQYPAFAKAYEAVCAQKISPALLSYALYSDGFLTKEELELEVALALRDGGPWGQQFLEPTFDGVFKLIDQRLVGAKHLKMNLLQEDKIVDAIAFNVNLDQWPNYRCEAVNILYRLNVNEFQNKKKLQLIVDHLEEA